MKKECVAMLLAGGQGSRLYVLTGNMAKPAVPFGGKFRIIDFPLSNCTNSGIDTVGVLTQYRPLELNSYIGNGQPWELDRINGGVHILPPYQSAGGAVWYKGTANAIYQNIGFVDLYDPEYVLVLSGDHIYKMDYSDMLRRHKEAKADCTISVMEVPWEDASRFGIMNVDGADITAVCATGAGDGEDTYFTLDGTGRITDTAYALYTPAGYRCLNVFVLRRDLLLELVAECASRNGYSLRRNILQEMGARLKLYGYVYDGYAAHINTLQSYYDRSMELLSTAVRQALFCPQRPVYGKENDSPSGYIDPDGGCVNSLIADGCDIRGSVKNCILFRNVRIERGASVENCILFKDTVVKKGASLHSVITDKYVTVSENVILTGHERYPMVVAKGVTV